ncbi:MAG TPA: acyltransferase [Acetobacteraceae bacterium]|jgi:exopolysaccharide production protein ExoZ|nr:acyltransferase [Acetobacteraceae bacterium]
MPTINNDTRPKIASLEGLRGVAVGLVFMVHYAVAWTLVFPQAANDSTATGVAADIAFSLGNAGVDLFMALSGYLIYDHLASRPQRFTGYLGRRMRRIFPAYLVVLAIYVSLMLLDPNKSKLPASMSASVAYVVECALLIPGFFGHEPIVGIAWSLTYEILFYLLLPVLIAVTDLRHRSWNQRVAVLSGVGLLVLLATAITGDNERVIMFVGGMLAREFLVRFRYSFPRPITAEIAALAVVGATFLYMAVLRGPLPFTYPLFPHSIIRSSALFIAFPMLLAVTLGVHGVCRRLFEWLPLRLLGEISYSFYLVHNLAMRVALPLVKAHASPSAPQALYWLAMPAAFAFCLVPALVLYATIERPISLRRPILPRDAVKLGMRLIATAPNS